MNLSFQDAAFEHDDDGGRKHREKGAQELEEAREERSRSQTDVRASHQNIEKQTKSSISRFLIVLKTHISVNSFFPPM